MANYGAIKVTQKQVISASVLRKRLAGLLHMIGKIFIRCLDGNQSIRREQIEAEPKINCGPDNKWI
jgi:hypothetical protein